MTCDYKNIFGKVGEGIHSYRIGNIAVLDVLATCFFAFLINRFFFPTYNYFLILLASLLLGIFMHRMFCVRTTIDKFLFR
jgi:hypothetical protein